ncbi:MAG: hypothetical protein LH606_20300 [Cytophagaceae bacterium]|nr:hypothetical protein [Cytophagaceae bacterium]
MKLEEKFLAKLLVEGNDDQHVVWAICEKLVILETFDVVDCNSDSQAIGQLTSRIKLRNASVLGVVLDADTDLAKRWTQIQNKLQPFGYPVPETPDLDGTLIPSPGSGYPQVGIWLMPDNQSTGMLEDFAQQLIPESDQLLPIVQQIIAELDTEPRKAKFKAVHKTKALIHTWLAWQEHPGTPMGQALTSSYLSTNHELCTRFVTWLNALFNT